MPTGADAASQALRSLTAELELVASNPARVAAACAGLEAELAALPDAEARALLLQVLPLLGRRVGPLLEPVFGLLEQACRQRPDPGPLLDGLLAARDSGLARRALQLAGELAGAGRLAVDAALAERLARHVDAEGSPFGEPAQLEGLAALLAHLPPAPGGGDPLEALLATAGSGARSLAARLLDRPGDPARPELARRLLGEEAHDFLRPYLDYTRAGHADLLALAGQPEAFPATLRSLREAERVCGPELLKEAVGALGWPRLNLGLEVRPRVAVSLAGGYPLQVTPLEAGLLEGCPGARRGTESFLFVAHGGAPAGPKAGPGDAGSDPVARFRAYNLEHAAALADFLDLAPLTRATVERLLGRMDRIVADYVALFSAVSDECAGLSALYADLKRRILAELEAAAGEPQLSIELTRLVQAFEDPRSAGAVRTLHGLKRYLHQSGLRLGLRLQQSGGRGTNRTVDLLLAARGRRRPPLRSLRYVDFEPASDGAAAAVSLPFAVGLAVDGLARQLLAGQESFPQVSAFLYGNEVHFYLAFKNHPAFLRLDLSPPLSGGMVDLEYWGVSKYELDQHPNPSLEGLRAFFEALDFEATIEQTRVRARYDKERALDLETVCEKAAALLRLAPYLMDVDWVVGDLDLPAAARAEVARAWAAFFARWGVLPLSQLLTSDRRGIRLGRERGPTGEREIAWDGQGPYRDAFCVSTPPETLVGLRHALAPGPLARAAPAGFEPAQLALERVYLAPLREALGRGELVLGAAGPAAAGAEVYQREDAAELFAGLLQAEPARLAAAARVANLVGPLERTLQFEPTATLQGREVQQARLALPGLTLGLHVLRDGAGIVRLALFSEGGPLHRRRPAPAREWSESWSCDAARLATLLRRANYLSGGDPGPAPGAGEIEELRAALRRPSRAPRRPPLPGERLVRGTGASPGRAVGRAVFGAAGRRPEELEGAVLVAATVRPEDNTAIFRSAGVVATGGGILSHAGLIALQFRKPALVIAGEWRQERDGSRALACRTLEYREEVGLRHGLELRLFRDAHEREHLLREGDLVALEAGQGLLRSFGQEREALALHEGLRLLAESGRGLQAAGEARQVLALRGHRLRARHQVERLLARLADRALARHAVHELLLGEPLSGAVPVAERAGLLVLLLESPQVGAAARECLVETLSSLEERQRDGARGALAALRAAGSLFEVLAERLQFRQRQALLEGVGALAAACGLAPPAPAEVGPEDVEAAARARLLELRQRQAAELAVAPPALLRHQLRSLARLDEVLGRAPASDRELQDRAAVLAEADAAALARHRPRRVLRPGDGGFELAPLIGWKAANLAELERLGFGALVPAWFVVSHAAFEQALEAPATTAGEPLRAAIAEVLARPGLDHARQSALVRDLWEGLVLPPELAAEVLSAYAGLAPGQDEPFVAVRSSAREEDTEGAARAGEFDTFLFVRGPAGLLQALKRAWSGLWTERALHNRAVLGAGAGSVGGGVLVQRMLRSRVAGVLQTVDVVAGDPRQMLVNAGLGLGEGVVSGQVAPDQVRVSKQGDLQRGPLRFQYVTSEKREQVVFDERAGHGTRCVPTLYHQRLRAALEYAELCELVAVAARLEARYGYPLDIEFALEGERLQVVQVRPVPAFQAALRETLERQPLQAATDKDGRQP